MVKKLLKNKINKNTKKIKDFSTRLKQSSCKIDAVHKCLRAKKSLCAKVSIRAYLTTTHFLQYDQSFVVIFKKIVWLKNYVNEYLQLLIL